MRIGWGAKVALGTVLPVLIGMGAFVLLTLENVRGEVRARVEDELRSQVQLLARTLPDNAGLGELARVIHGRITVIAEDGAVLADSEGDPARMENHGTRPEILDARKGDVAVVERYSRTVERDLIYAAARLEGQPGFVRVARDVSGIEEELQHITRTFWFVAAAVLVLGALFALLFARRMTRPVARLTEAAVARAQGGPPLRVSPVGRDEVAHLAEAFNEMTDRLDESVAIAKAETARLVTLLGGMSEGVVAVDAGEVIAFLNNAARGILGLSEDAEGSRLYEQVREPRILGLVQTAARDGKALEAEISYEGPPRRMIQVYAAPAGSDVILVLRDMSKVRRLERMRTDFVSNVSHELRTPLASIAAAVETLEDAEARKDDDVGARFVRMLRRNVGRLEALLDDILALSRFESRPETFERVSLDLAAVGRSAAEDHRERARRGEIDLRVDAAESLPVEGNAEALRRILDNLIVNAITYTPAGGSVEVELRRDNGDAVLRVRDTGIGIPPGDLERIFERFYRVDKSRSRSAGGTGLGLAIVKHAVGFHGGDVQVTSEQGKGSTFTVRLPLARNGDES